MTIMIPSLPMTMTVTMTMTTTKMIMFSFFLLTLLTSTNHKNMMASASVWFVPYPEGGDCRNVTFSDASRRLVCITGGALYGPSPATIDNEVVYFGQQGEDFAFFQGDEEDGTATAEHIATVRLGYNVPNATDCFLTVNGDDCCSCRSCLDADGNLVGMKGDCTNVPNGRQVRECEPLYGYFPLDLSMNQNGVGTCGAAGDDTTTANDGGGSGDREDDETPGKKPVVVENTGKETDKTDLLGLVSSNIDGDAPDSEEFVDSSGGSILRTSSILSIAALVLAAHII